MSEDLSGFSLLDLFREEVETHSGVLNDGLVALENGDVDLEPLMRAAHSLKGAARIVDLEVVVRIAHAMEDCFVAAQEDKLPHLPRHAEPLFRGIDLIVQVAGLAETELPSFFVREAEAIESLIADLETLADPSSAPREEIQEGRESAPPASQPEQEAIDAPEDLSGPGEARLSRAPGATIPDSRDLRIRAENLTRLMGLAGEAVVAAGWLEQLTDSLSSLESRHGSLGNQLELLSRMQVHGEDFELALERSRSELEACVEALAERKQALDLYARRSAELSSRLYREVLSGRMRPFSDGTKAFPRLVRDLAQELGKMVRLEIRGPETEVDRDILERLEAPLNHLLRNSLDHGIELPDDRRKKGKEPTGRILLEARHQGGKLLVTVSDDGCGIELDHLRKKIVERRALSAERADALEKEELFEFLFLPGFSTREKVSEISGRGVGLDVVQTMVREVGGDVHVDCPDGSGVCFTLELPVTRSVLRVLLVEMAGQPFAVPMAGVERVLRLSRGDISLLEERPYTELDGRNLGLVSARQVLGLPIGDTDGKEVPVVVVGDRNEIYGLVVDRFLGEREVVVQGLDPRLGPVRNIAASALMHDGSPVMILDIDDVLKSIVALLEGKELATIGYRQGGDRSRVLIADDSPTQREAERVCLEKAGFAVEAAIDGHDAWHCLRAASFDLLISDVDMPRVTGLELVRRIRREDRWSNLPIILFSHKDREEDRQRGLESGADRFVSKAGDLEDTLLQTVRELIGSPKE